MYDELVKRLRNCTSDTVEDCAGCPYQGGYKGTYCMNGLITEAADAIEELFPFKKQVEKGMGLLDKADELLNAVKPRWIPVTERLPEKGCYVLVYEDGDIMMASYEDGNWVLRDMYEIIELKPTYWMPLPESPKEEMK